MSGPRVLADCHHEDLYKSLRLLFEKRMGGEVYRPVGMEWFDKGWWSYPFHARETAQQFLGDAYKHPGITLEEFLAPNAHGGWAPAFDLMLSSTPQQFYAWEAKRRELGITIPHVFQSGNDWTLPDCRYLLNSTTLPAPPGCSSVYYHQEFSLRDYYKPDVKPGRVIASFMHMNPRRDFFYALEREMPGWTFREYGAGGRDGQPADLPAAMRETRYLWHEKKTEGYGFNVHYAAACGVPLLMYVAANRHQAIGALLKPGETCLDLADYTSPGHLADAIRRFDKDHEEHSKVIHDAFRAHVDFDAEAARIKEWLQTVIAR